MGIRRWSDSDLEEAVRNCSTLSDTTVAIGLKNYCGNRQSVKAAIGRLGLNTDHFAHTHAKVFNKKLEPSEIFIENSSYSTSNLRRRMIKDLGVEDKCNNCGITSWLGSSITFEVHHKNGISNDHREDNLELLCPNCHSIKTKEQSRSRRKKRKPNTCVDCGAEITRRAVRCVSCAGTKYSKTKIEWPEYDDLIMLMDTNQWNYSKVGRALGVSDNAIRKHISRHEKRVCRSLSNSDK